jgi:hypothetical protein
MTTPTPHNALWPPSSRRGNKMPGPGDPACGPAAACADQVTDLGSTPATGQAAVDLYWIPLGAGGHVVRFNGKVYEAIDSMIEHRPRRDIYHTALTILVPTGRFAVEMTPIPNRRSRERGVVAEGAVGTKWAGRLRLFRYEVRRWRDGVIPDLQFAVASPIRLTDSRTVAESILELLPLVPTPVWGRDELRVGEMWTCNSIISWVLAEAGLDTAAIHLPTSGRAPGWEAGIAVADRVPLSRITCSA